MLQKKKDLQYDLRMLKKRMTSGKTQTDTSPKSFSANQKQRQKKKISKAINPLRQSVLQDNLGDLFDFLLTA